MHFPRSEATMPGTSYLVSIALRGIRESTAAMPAGYRGKRRNRAVSFIHVGTGKVSIYILFSGASGAMAWRHLAATEVLPG